MKTLTTTHAGIQYKLYFFDDTIDNLLGRSLSPTFINLQDAAIVVLNVSDNTIVKNRSMLVSETFDALLKVTKEDEIKLTPYIGKIPGFKQMISDLVEFTKKSGADGHFAIGNVTVISHKKENVTYVEICAPRMSGKTYFLAHLARGVASIYLCNNIAMAYNIKREYDISAHAIPFHYYSFIGEIGTVFFDECSDVQIKIKMAEIKNYRPTIKEWVVISVGTDK